MNNWQEWIVALVLLFCILLVGKRIYTAFRPSEKGDGCGCGCAGCTKGTYHKPSHGCEENASGNKKK